MSDKIVLTHRGMLFRKELEEELALEDHRPRLPKLTIEIGSPQYKKMVFGQQTHRRIVTEVQTARELRSEETKLYPNYLRRDAKEYPPSHVCNFKVPNYSFRRKERNISTNLKTVHHTVYNSDKRWIIQKDPNVEVINKTVHGPNKSLAFPINISNTKFDVPSPAVLQDEIDEANLSKSIASLQKDISPTLTRETFRDSISWSKTRSTNFLHTAREYNPQLTSKTDKLIQLFDKTQRDYHNLLIRVEEKAIQKVVEFETDRGQLFQFKNKLREAEETIMKLRANKKGEDLRYLTRLENFSRSKYSKYKHHKVEKPAVEKLSGDPLVIDTIKTSLKSEIKTDHSPKGDHSPKLDHSSKGEGSPGQFPHDSVKGFPDLSMLKHVVHELSDHSKRTKLF